MCRERTLRLDRCRMGKELILIFNEKKNPASRRDTSLQQKKRAPSNRTNGLANDPRTSRSPHLDLLASAKISLTRYKSWPHPPRSSASVSIPYVRGMHLDKTRHHQTSGRQNQKSGQVPRGSRARSYIPSARAATRALRLGYK
jgi:hypothetical protein